MSELDWFGGDRYPYQDLFVGFTSHIVNQFYGVFGETGGFCVFDEFSEPFDGGAPVERVG